MLDVGVDATVTFSEENGQRLMIYADAAGDRVVMPAFAYAEPGAALMASLSGTYYSPELEISLRILEEDGKLIARHPRHEDETLTHLRDAQFTNGWATLRFLQGDDGDVNGMFLSADRTRNLEFLKQHGPAAR